MNEGETTDETADEAHTADSVPPGVVPVRLRGNRPGRPFVVDRVLPIPCHTARYIVRVGGQPYAGYFTRPEAYSAIAAWRERWPALAGKSVDII